MNDKIKQNEASKISNYSGSYGLNKSTVIDYNKSKINIGVNSIIEERFNISILGEKQDELHINIKDEYLDNIEKDYFHVFLLRIINNYKINGTEIKTIHFSSKLKKYITEIILENHPGIEALRIKEGVLINIIFGGVKELNKLGKELVDNFIEIFKKRINKNTASGISEEIKDQILKSRNKGNNNDTFFRVIRSDYKNHTLSIPKGITNISNLLFGDEINKNKFLGEVFDETFSNMSEDELRGKMIGLDNIEGGTFMGINEIKTILRKKYIDEFKFGFRKEDVKNSEEVDEIETKKIKRIFNILRKAELGGREDFEKKIIDNNIASYDEEKSDGKKNKALEIFFITLENFTNTNEIKYTYSIKGSETRFPIIQDNNTESNGISIQNLLLTRIKKGVEITGIYIEKSDKNGKIMSQYIKDDFKKSLEKLKEYINLYNEVYDYIPPFKLGENNEETEENLKEIIKIDKQLNNDYVDIEKIKRNYKGTLTKKTLEIEIEGKKGVKGFIDIVGMGIMNTQDYQNWAIMGKRINKEIKSIESKLKINISISKENRKELEDELNLLKNDLDDFKEKEIFGPGFSITNAFHSFILNIEKKYPTINLSLGGDEIMFFIKGDFIDNNDEIFSTISLELRNQGLQGRISGKYIIKNNQININSFSNMDGATEINRGLEEQIIDLVEKYDINISSKSTVLEYSSIIEDMIHNKNGSDDIKNFARKFKNECKKQEFTLLRLLNNDVKKVRFRIEEQIIILEKIDTYIKISII